MNLVQPQGITIQAGGPGQQFPVCRHRFGRVTNMSTQVQALVGPDADAAGA
jgi:hypothetical protein